MPARGAGKIASPIILLILAILVWVFSGFYTVGPDELGVVQLWGESDSEAKPGLHYHLPYPIEKVTKIKTAKVWRYESAPTVAALPAGGAPAVEPAPAPLFMTRDGNLVEVGFTVQYRINKAEQYLFMVEDPQATVGSAARAVMNEVIGLTPLEQVLTVGKEKIQKDALAKLQGVLDQYKAGIKLVALQIQRVDLPGPVRGAYEQVTAAREKKLQLISQAQSQADQRVEKAKGEAAAMLAMAKAYREEKTKRAAAEAKRFTSLYAEYEKAPEVTRRRLYLETMEKVLSRAGKIVLEPDKNQVHPLWHLGDDTEKASGGGQAKALKR